jgi:hypothetical protein
MSSKPKTETTRETKSTDTTAQQNVAEDASKTPWDTAAGYFSDLYGKGAAAVNSVNNNVFGGNFTTPATEAQRSSISQLLSAAPNLGVGAGPLSSMAMRIAGGEFLDPNNPILRAGIDATINPIKNTLINQILPGATDVALKGGAYGGTGNTLLQTKAMDDYARSSQDVSSKMTLDWLNNRFGDIFQTPGLFQAANTLSLAPGTVTGLAGEQEHALNDYGTQDALQRYQNQLQAPFFGLSDFANLLTQGGFSNQTGTTAGTSSGTSDSTGKRIETGAAPDMATQWLQGGLGGLSTLSSLGKAFPATMGAIGGGSIMGPIMTGLSFLSERKYKENIVKLWDKIYSYTYKTLPSLTFIGMMADEVNPDAVFEQDGKKYIDYARVR